MTHARIPDFSQPLPTVPTVPASRAMLVQASPRLPVPPAPPVRSEPLTVTTLQRLLSTARVAGEFVTAVTIIAGGIAAYGYLPL